MTTTFHYRVTKCANPRYNGNKQKIIGSKTDLRMCAHCKKKLPMYMFRLKGTKNSAGHYYLHKICRPCHNIQKREQRYIHANTPAPVSNHCDCCHTITKTLCKDHIKKTKIFRGHLCNWCNVGIGQLGDNLPGVLQAAVYLENDIDKIIETLHKVFNEMFARTHD